MLDSTGQQLNSFLSRMVVAQVQLSQVGRVGLESGDQTVAAFLCDLAARKTEQTQTGQLLLLDDSSFQFN